MPSNELPNDEIDSENTDDFTSDEEPSTIYPGDGGEIDPEDDGTGEDNEDSEIEWEEEDD